MEQTVSADAPLADRLAEWLSAHLPAGAQPRVDNVEWSKAAGFSAETIFFDAAWTQRGTTEERRLVLRKQIVGHDLLHQADLRFQWEVMKALKTSGEIAVPTPGLIGMEEDGAVLGTPFLVMERLPGRIVPQHPNYNVAGWLHDLPSAERRRVWCNGIAAMASVHRVDWRNGFEVLARGKEPGLKGYVDFIEDWCRWAVAGRDFSVADAALAFLRERMPAAPPTEVLWGDPITSNTLFDADGKVTGLIDWELAALGPGEIDLAWWMLFDDLFSSGMRVPRLEGLPDREETIAAYEEARGRPVADLAYYEVLAWLRMTIISVRAVDRQVALGNFRANNSAWSHNPSAQGLAKRIGSPEVVVGDEFHEFIGLLMVRD